MSLSNVKLLPYTEDMPSLLSWADLGISACGITSLEAAFMGLPSIVFTVEKNQAGIGERLHDLGVAHHIGEPVDMEPEFIRDNINSLILDRGRRREMSEKGRNLVDGRGAEKVHRLIHYLGGGEIDIKECIRMAENGDCVPLWRLANEKEVRKNSFSRGPFPLNTHRSWFEDKLKSPDTLLFVLDIGGQIAGQIRYERSGSEASVHFSLAPAFRGRGLARKMIECTFKKACEILEVESVKGIVKDFNGPSIKTFFKTGFIRTGSMDISGEAATIFKKACH
jgi:UDP-2,4-diacetamido-2,4,6-trideoxy-beta-L-altropyranose hydrolase